VLTTSEWSRTQLLERYGLDPDRVAVARPGADPAEQRAGTRAGGRLLCVGAVAPHKGQDVLVDALAGLRDSDWHCTITGPLDRNPGFVDELQRRIAAAGLADRTAVTGPADHDGLRELYAAADLLVLPSRLEAYGMVVTEALAAGLPVVASRVGGVPEAVGTTSLGEPGLLVPPGDPPALREALAAWLGDPDLRTRLHTAARERRGELAGWDTTTRAVAAALSRARREPASAMSRGGRR
jgi:glycosyltransferase involved in cell wall biosynthesis